MNPFTESTVAVPLAETKDGHSTVSAPDAPAGFPDADPRSSLPSHEKLPCTTDGKWRVPSRSIRPRVLRRRRIGTGPATQGRFHRLASVFLAGVFAMSCPGLVAAAVDINSATPEQLETVRGIGPKTARIIVNERMRGGNFESLEDLAERVKGVGLKKARSMQAAGLTIGPAVREQRSGATPAPALPARKAGR